MVEHCIKETTKLQNNYPKSEKDFKRYLIIVEFRLLFRQKFCPIYTYKISLVIMSTVTKYLVYGPKGTLDRMSPKLFEEHEPKFLYTYSSQANDDMIYVAVYEQFEKQINATITITCIIECTANHNRVVLKKAGGRMGFRGSSLTEERNVESDIVDFIMDFSKRFGLSIQEEVEEKAVSDEEETD